MMAKSKHLSEDFYEPISFGVAADNRTGMPRQGSRSAER